MFSGNNMPRSCSAGVFNRCLTVRTSALLEIFMVCLKSTMIPFMEKFVATITLLLQPARSNWKSFSARRLGYPACLCALRQKVWWHWLEQPRWDHCRQGKGWRGILLVRTGEGGWLKGAGVLSPWNEEVGRSFVNVFLKDHQGMKSQHRATAKTEKNRQNVFDLQNLLT